MATLVIRWNPSVSNLPLVCTQRVCNAFDFADGDNVGVWELYLRQAFLFPRTHMNLYQQLVLDQARAEGQVRSHPT